MVRNVNWQYDDLGDRGDLGAGRLERNDLLPWADPYILALMASLEREFLNSPIDSDGL